MDELSPDARRFIAEALADDAPSPDETEKTWDEIVAVVTGAEMPTAAVPTRARRRWIRLAIVLAVVAIVGAIAWWRGADRAQHPAPPPAAQPRPSNEAVALDVAPPAIDASSILARAEAALHEGRPAEALDLLEQHAELDPTGADSERRMARRIAALCALGRTDRAQAEATGFLARHGASPFAAEVRAGCVK